MKRSAFFFPGLFLILLLTCSAISAKQATGSDEMRDRRGATIRLRQPAKGKVVYLIFTADSMFEGGQYALDVLREHNVKASFFLTGNFLRDSLSNGSVIHRMVNEGHYVGPHSDRHILLADWDASRTILADRDSALRDMRNNYVWLAKWGVDTTTARFIVPPFEWYHGDHITAYRHAGYYPVNPSPGFITYRDYTTPDMEEYCPSDSIWANFIDNLNHKDIDGNFIILHLGTQDSRTDKFYYRLGELIDSLKLHGYLPIRLL